MLIRLLPVAVLLLPFLTVTVLAQETPEEAKRREAVEAEIKADAEKRAKIEAEIKRKEAEAREGGKTESDWDALNATISGRVLDATGAAVAGAFISAFWYESWVSNAPLTQNVGQSEQDGTFRFIFTLKLPKAVTELEVRFTASHTDHLSATSEAHTLQRESEVKDLAFALPPAGSINGRITDADGRAIENATVVATTHIRPNERKAWQIVRKALTDAAGNYTIKGLPTDKYVLSVECAGYKSLELKDATAVKAGESVPGKDMTLTITTAIKGRIEVRQMYDAPNGSCTFYDGETRVKACSLVMLPDKTFTVIDPPVGTWEIEINWWQYSSVRRTAVTVNQDQHADIGLVEVETVIEDLPHD